MYGYHNFSHFRVYLRIPNMIEITVDVFLLLLCWVYIYGVKFRKIPLKGSYCIVVA